MIVFLDIETQEILLYKEDGLTRIPFRSVNDLTDIAEDSNLLYITNAVEVNVSDIIQLIKQTGVKVEEDVLDEQLYLCSAEDGVVYIDEELSFESVYDLKPLTEEMQRTIKRKPIVQGLIKIGKLKVVGSKEMKKIKRQEKKKLQQDQEQKEKMDKELDSIIIDKKVEDFDPSEDDDMDTKGHDAEQINILSRGGGDMFASAGKQSMSELLEEIEGFEEE